MIQDFNLLRNQWISQLMSLQKFVLVNFIEPFEGITKQNKEQTELMKVCLLRNLKFKSKQKEFKFIIETKVMSALLGKLLNFQQRYFRT